MKENKKHIQVMFGSHKILGKKKIAKEKCIILVKNAFSHVWFYYEKCKRKLNIIKIIKNFAYF